MFDLNDLEVFVAVVEEGGLTPVAARLGVPKSTLSRRISQLEERLGQPLLLRQSNRMLATEAGCLFHRYSRQMLDLADQSRIALDELRGSVSGDVQLNIHNAFERGWLPALLEQFVREHPRLRLQVVPSAAPPAALQSGQADLWLWLGDCSDQAMRCERLGEWSVGLYASPAYLARHGHPKTDTDLKTHFFIGDDADDARAPFLRWLAQQGFTQIFRSNEPAAQRAAVTAGLGLGFLFPEQTAPGLVQVMPPRPEWDVPLWLVSHVDLHRTPKVQAALAALKGGMQA